MAGPIINPANGHSYFLLTQNTWTASEAEAVGLGGHLATVRNAAEDAWIWTTFGGGRDLWIGYYSPTHDSNYIWVSGEVPSYTNWFSGRPDFLDSQSYVLKDINISGRWDNIDNVNAATPSRPLFGIVEVVPEPASLSILFVPTLLFSLRRRCGSGPTDPNLL